MNKENLTIDIQPPENIPDSGIIVLGRFQPFHRGHAYLVKKAIEIWQDMDYKIPLRIAIGSANKEETPDNPWTWEERKEMIQEWIDSEDILHSEEIDYCPVPDIDNPPKWVKHAEKYHGKSGILVTSDENTTQLYSNSGWEVISIELDKRDSYEGWRVRETAKMLSTVLDEDARKKILAVTIPECVVEWLILDDRIKRLAFLGPNVEYVG